MARIACFGCDTDEADGITLAKAKKLGWHCVEKDEPHPTYIEPDAQWWTHIGWCAECWEESGRHEDGTETDLFREVGK